jgi:hypothetical protein
LPRSVRRAYAKQVTMRYNAARPCVEAANVAEFAGSIDRVHDNPPGSSLSRATGQLATRGALAVTNWFGWHRQIGSSPVFKERRCPFPCAGAAGCLVIHAAHAA